MAQGMNGAWLALGVAGAVAAAGVALGRGGSRATKSWSDMTRAEREREERAFQRFKQQSEQGKRRSRSKQEREPDWHRAWYDTSRELD